MPISIGCFRGVSKVSGNPLGISQVPSLSYRAREPQENLCGWPVPTGGFVAVASSCFSLRIKFLVVLIDKSFFHRHNSSLETLLKILESPMGIP